MAFGRFNKQSLTLQRYSTSGRTSFSAKVHRTLVCLAESLSEGAAAIAESCVRPNRRHRPRWRIKFAYGSDDREKCHRVGGNNRPLFLLIFVLKACPDLASFARNGIATWLDSVTTTGIVGPYLGISPSAWQEAKDNLGIEHAAILQRFKAPVILLAVRGDHGQIPHKAGRQEEKARPCRTACWLQRAHAAARRPTTENKCTAPNHDLYNSGRTGQGRETRSQIGHVFNKDLRAINSRAWRLRPNTALPSSPGTFAPFSQGRGPR